MPITPDQQSYLSTLLPYLDQEPQTTQQQDPPSLLTRAAEGIANAPVEAGRGLINMLAGVAQAGVPEEDVAKVGPVQNLFSIPRATTTGEMLADTPGNLLASAPAFIAPELAAGRGASLLGLGGTASRIVGGAAAGAANATDEGPQGMAVNAGLMGGMAALGGLGRLARALPLAGLAGGAAAYNYSQTGDATSALTSGGILGVLGMLHAGPATTSESTPTVTQEKGLVPYVGNRNARPMGVPYDPDADNTPIIDVGPGKGSTPRLGGAYPALQVGMPALEDTDTRFTQGQVTTDATGRVAVATPQPAAPMLDDRSSMFTLGDVTSQPNAGRFTLGADTSEQPNGGLPGPTGQPPLMLQPPAKPPGVVLPEGTDQLKLQLPPNQTQIVSTAFQHSDGNVYAGSAWDQPHEAIGTLHDIDDVPQSARGFIVHNADGTQTFENRDDAYDIAVASGQHRDPTLGKPLNSTDLQVAGANVTSQPAPTPPPAPTPAPPTDYLGIQQERAQRGDLATAQSVGLTADHVADFDNGTNNTGLNPHGFGQDGLTSEVMRRRNGDVTSQPEAPAAPASDRLTQLRTIGQSDDPLAELKKLPSADRQALFEASRANGRKGASLTRLAENAKAFHQDTQPTTAAAEPPPSKDVAALGGSQTSASDSMTASLDHISSPDVREDLQYLRDKITEHRAEGDTDAANYKLDLLKTELAKHGPPAVADVPRAIVTSQQARGGASWLTDDTVKSADVSYSGDPNEESPVSFSEDPKESNAALVDKTLDDGELASLKTAFGGDTTSDTGNQQTLAEFLKNTDVPDYDDAFQPKPEDLADEPDSARDSAEEAMDQQDAREGTQSATETDHLTRLLSAIQKGTVSDEDLGLADKPKPTVEKVRQARGARRAVRGVIKGGMDANGVGGFVTNEFLGYLGRFAAGGLIGAPVGYNLDKENRIRGTILGFLGGGLSLGHMSQFIRFLTHDLPEFGKREAQGLKDVTSQPGARAADFLDNIQARGRASSEEPMLRRLMRDASLAFTRSEDLREAMQRSKTADLQDMADDAISAMHQSGDYARLTPAQRTAYEEFRNTQGRVDATTGKVVDDPMAVTKFMAALSDKPVFAGAAVKARIVLMEQQRLLLNGGAKGGLAQAIMNTIGKYSADQYKLFTTDTWKPSQAMIDSVVKNLSWLRAFPDYDVNLINKHVDGWLSDIYRNRQGYSGGGGGDESQTLDDLLKRKAGGLPADLEARIRAYHPTASSVDDIVTSQLYLPNDVKEALWKQIKAGNYITPQWRDMTGLYTDPMQRDVATMMKLMPAVRASKLFDFIANGKNSNGIPYSLSPKDYVQTRNTTMAQLAVATDPKVKGVLQRRLLDLDNRVKLPSAQNLGSLSESLVSPEFAHALPSMDMSKTGNGGPVMQAVMEGTKAIKLGQTLLNPVSYVRWTWNAPFLGAVAGNSPFDIWNGYKTALGNGSNGAVKTRLTRLGVMASDIATNDFNTTAKRALSGTLDQNLMDRFLGTPVMRKAADIYGLADNAIRGATFLRREQEVLGKMAPDVAAGRVTSQEAAAAAEKEAIRYTNRYTVDYGNVPGGLAACRKMPFFSLYMTYGYETSRILKNIMVDASGKGPYGKDAQAGAVAKLAAISAVPLAITAGAKAMLSPKDQKDWEHTVALMQPYQRARMLVPMGKRADGSWRYVDLTSLDPVGDWNTFGRAIASGDWRQVVANNPYIGTENTPALNMATEIITGQNSRTGRAINTPGRALDTARQELAPAFLGGYEFDNLMRAVQPNDQGGYGVTQLGSGKGYSLDDLLWTYATGVRPTTIRTDWAAKTAVGQAQGDITTERQYMMDTLQSNATNEAKELAKKRFNDALTVIVARLKNRMDQGM